MRTTIRYFSFTPAIMPPAFRSCLCPFIGKTARHPWSLRNMPAFAREQGLEYRFFTAADFHRDLPEAERAEVRRILSQQPEMVREYTWGLSAVYRLKQTDAGSPPLLTPLVTLASPR